MKLIVIRFLFPILQKTNHLISEVITNVSLGGKEKSDLC